MQEKVIQGDKIMQKALKQQQQLATWVSKSI